MSEIEALQQEVAKLKQDVFDLQAEVTELKECVKELLDRVPAPAVSEDLRRAPDPVRR